MTGCGFMETAPDAPSQVSAARLARVRAAMREKGIDAVFSHSLTDIAWLTGFEEVFDDEPAHRCVVTAEAARLHTDSRYADAAARAAASARDAGDADWRIDLEPRSASVWLADVLADVQPCAGELVVAIEDTLPLKEFRALEAVLPVCSRPVRLEESDAFILALRARKDEREIAAMMDAQRITDAAFAHTVESMRAARRQGRALTERDVQLELEDAMRRLGSEGLAFSSIVAAGENGAAPHSIPSSRELREGDMVVLDFGARFGGYCADMTRVVSLGEPSPEAARAYAAIRRANEEVEAMLRPGVTGREAHEHAESVLAQCGFGGCMGHSLGHGVGLDIHERPTLGPLNGAPLEPGNVVTVEPGIYIPGEFGCRLEDFGVICEDGFQVFTTTPHDIVII